MTKVTVTPPPGWRGKSPTEEILDEAAKIIQVTDARGRVFEVARVSMSARRRVFKILSAESQDKPQYLGMVMLAASVKSINGEEVLWPRSEMQFDALIDRLDDEGFDAISPAYRKHFRQEEEVAAEAGE